MKPINRKLRALLCLLLCAAMLGSLAVVAYAETATAKVTGQFRYTEARRMLTMINQFRTGSDAWYWNSDDKTKTVCSNLGELSYDYALEEIAMKRARELALYYSHTRPTGQDCFTLSSDGVQSWGENIAYGQGSAEEVFIDWREDNDSYLGQGHRRNMLNSSFNAVGFGCFYHKGVLYWAQEFGRSQSGRGAPTANENDVTGYVDYSTDLVDWSNEYNGRRTHWQLKTVDGTAIGFQNYSGTPLFFLFHQDSCSNCEYMLPELAEADWVGRDITVIAVDIAHSSVSDIRTLRDSLPNHGASMIFTADEGDSPDGYYLMWDFLRSYGLTSVYLPACVVVIDGVAIDYWGGYSTADECRERLEADGVLQSKPTITTHPSNKTAAAGSTVKFTVGASNATSYQWQYRTSSSGSWNNCSGNTAKTNTLSVTAESYRNGYQYRCKVSNNAGTVISNAATLTVNSKPTITTQPTNKTATAGTTVKFTVGASNATSYQWQYYASSTDGWKNCSASSAKTATLSITAESYRNGYKYRCKVTNSAGTVISNAATLTVNSKPTITTQPANKTAAAGTTVKFTVGASNATSYQWQYYASSTDGWKNCSASSAKTATLSITAESYRNGYKYRCKVTNSVGTVTSNAATLTVASNGKPTILTHPSGQTSTVGGTAKFSVEANGSNLKYQWQYYDSSSGTWANVTNSAYTGLTSATMSVPVTAGRNGLRFRCKVSNSNGTVYSNSATLKVKPTITTQPSSKTAAAGTTATFTVAASGPNLSYQWQYYDSSSGSWASITNSAYTGLTSATMSVPATMGRSGMKFRCKVSNANGTVTSNSATLTVTSDSKPTITTQPSSKTAAAGTTVTFTVGASGANLSYQWQYYNSSSGTWSNLTNSAYTGLTSATMGVQATAGRDGLKYRCKVTNAAGSVYSDPATLTVVTQPNITSYCSSVTTSCEGTEEFYVEANGGGLSYQWQYSADGGNTWGNITNSSYSGIHSSVLSVPATFSRSGYQFRCKVSNAVGTIYSPAATLTVG